MDFLNLNKKKEKRNNLKRQDRYVGAKKLYKDSVEDEGSLTVVHGFLLLLLLLP